MYCVCTATATPTATAVTVAVATGTTAIAIATATVTAIDSCVLRFFFQGPRVSFVVLIAVGCSCGWLR